MKRCLLCCLIIARSLSAQEVPAPEPPAPAQGLSSLRVLQQTVVPQPDGGTLTLQRVEAPTALTVRMPQPVVLTAEEQASLERRAAKESGFVSLSATLHSDGFTLLRCFMEDGQTSMQAVSTVDFRLLAGGEGCVETETKFYSLAMGIGASEEPLPEGLAALAQTLPQDGTAAFVPTENKAVLNAEEQRIVTAFETLHSHVQAHHAELLQQQAQREARDAAREQAPQTAPPPAPRHATLRFWKLPRQPLPVIIQPAPAATNSSSGEGGASQP